MSYLKWYKNYQQDPDLQTGHQQNRYSIHQIPHMSSNDWTIWRPPDTCHAIITFILYSKQQQLP